MLGVVSDPIRVLWLIKGLGPGGAEHLLVAAAAARDRDAFAYEAAYLLPWKDALVGRLEALGVGVTCLGVANERDLRWVGRLRRRLRDDPVDIVHVHSPYVAALARLAIRSLPTARRPRVVSTEHNAWTTFKGPTRFLNARTARFDDATVAVSAETRASMSPAARDRCEVLVHGIDTVAAAALRAERGAVRSELGIDPDTVLVGTVANYHPKKDWPNVLQAIRRATTPGARGAGPPIRACLVGQGPLQREVEALHHDLGLDDGTVLLPGFRPDAVRLMAGCDIFVLGSRWEGLPVAIMEALALGLPIVATAVGGIPEALHDGVDAVLVPPGDPEALAAALGALADDPERRARLGAAAARRAPEFDVRRAQTRLETIYREVLGRREVAVG